MATSFVVQPVGRPLRGRVPVPSDGPVLARALVLAALAEGKSEVARLTAGDPEHPAIGVLRALGVSVEIDRASVKIEGRGLAGLAKPSGPLFCGSSLELAAVLSGVLSAQLFPSVITGAAGLLASPFGAVAGPLRRRGGVIEGQFHQEAAGEITPPLELGPVPEALPLLEIEESLDHADPRAKGALLLSGLYAQGGTYLREPLVSADHTERLLSALGAPVQAVGTMVALEPDGWGRALPGFSLTPPGDSSATLSLVVAACAVPGSELSVRGAGTNPTRAGVLEQLRDAGAAFEIEERGASLGEPVADLHVGFAPLRAASLGGERALRAERDVAASCALLALSSGEGVVSLEALPPRHPARRQLSLMAEALRALGLFAELSGGALVVRGKGGEPLSPADLDAGGDPSVAMALTSLALAASGECRVRRVDAVAEVFPRFAGTLRALGADVRAVEGLPAGAAPG